MNVHSKDVENYDYNIERYYIIFKQLCCDLMFYWELGT